MSRCHVRCRCCEARRVLRVKPDELFKWDVKRAEFINTAPACNTCGKNDYRIDAWMNARDTRTSACMCKGYVQLTHREPWPHRIASPYCWYRKDGTQRNPGDADFKDFQLEQMGNENVREEQF